MSYIERIIGGDIARSSAAWTSGTAGDTTLSLSVTGYNTVVITMRSGVITGGVLSFEFSDDGSNWYPIAVRRQSSYTAESTYTIGSGATISWTVPVSGFTNFRVRLSTVITGAGTVNLGMIGQVFSSTQTVVVGQDTAANLNAQMTGDVAHDSIDSGNPLKIGGVAVAHGSSPTAVAAGDRTRALFNRHGIPFVIGGHPNIITKTSRFTGAQTDTDIIGAIGSGNKIVLTGLIVTVSKDVTVNVAVKVGFGAANIPADGTAVTGIVFDHDGFEAGSGVSIGNSGGIISIGADGEELRLTSSAPTTGSLIVTVSYYIVES